ncbi:Dynamin-related protein 1E [Capsicum chinense]|nr:Dynamin-related protein 1E [Capsicum chinense]
MINARRKEREYFASSPDYRHLASKMGSEYLAKLLSKHLESVIRGKIPGISSVINKSIDELESEMDHLGRPISVDAGAQLYISWNFAVRLTRYLRSIWMEDGYQPHLIAPEQGYRRLIEGALNYFRGPAEASVDAELKRFPSLQSAIAAASYEALEKFCEEGRQTVLRLMDMEASYLTVDFFRKLPQEVDKGGEMQQLHLL